MATNRVSNNNALQQRDKIMRRPKACINCRKSKVKCLKDDNDEACKRCKAHGLQCLYEIKVASYKVAGGESPSKSSTNVPIEKILNPISSNVSSKKYETSLIDNKNPSLDKDLDQQKVLNKWENSVENRLMGFGSQLTTIISLLQTQTPNISPIQTPRHELEVELPIPKRQRIEPSLSSISASSSPTSNKCESRSNSTGNSNANRDRNSGAVTLTTDPVVRLNSILSKGDAAELFEFFNKNISPQLFGFDISKYPIDSIWKTCPLLIATITCIASIHHPNLRNLSSDLESIVYDLSKSILFRLPTNEIEAFNTIMALCFCGFWFNDNQMFTGIALQLSKTMSLIHPNSKSCKIIPRKDRLKLWYLLYILDGQQSLVFNREPIIDSRDPTFKKSRDLLVNAENEDLKDTKPDVKTEKSVINLNTNYADIRLISQVEYHQAINAVFEGNAWDLLTPSSFGLPFKTNLELDKWMVQWTVLLSPFKNNPIWSSKSTLIYYNFAKIHINSQAVRKFQANGVDLPKFDEIDDDFFDSNINNNSNGNKSLKIQELLDDSNTDDTDDEGIDDIGELSFGKELSPVESRKVSAELALSSAETVLNIVLSDSDILSVLRYVPIHIHIMLYYAALLILKPHACLHSSGQNYDKYKDENERFEASLNAIKLVKRLRHSIFINPPTDRDFSNKIIEGLTNILQDKVRQMRKEIDSSNYNSNVKEEHLQQLDQVVLDNDARELYHSQRKRGQDFKIAAWPGFDPGHPTKTLEKALKNGNSNNPLNSDIKQPFSK